MMMKKLIIIFMISFCTALLTFGVLAQSTTEETITDATDDISSGNKCKWKQVRCSGWLWSNTYEACLTNGDGNKCSCGSATRDC